MSPKKNQSKSKDREDLSISNFLRQQYLDEHLISRIKVWENVTDPNDLVEHREINNYELKVMNVLVSQCKTNNKIKVILGYTFWNLRFDKIIDIGIAYDERGDTTADWLKKNENPFEFIFRKEYNVNSGRAGIERVLMHENNCPYEEFLLLFNPVHGKKWKKLVRPEVHQIIKILWLELINNN